MTPLKEVRGSIAFSCVLHAVAIVFIAYLPLEAITRFYTSGQRETISLTLSLSNPTPPSTALPISLDTPQETSVPPVSAEIEPRRPPRDSLKKFDVSRSQDVRFPPVATPTSPIPPIAIPERAERAKDEPTVQDVPIRRPRRRPSVKIPPIAAAVPIDNPSGLDPTRVEFQSSPPPEYPAAAVADQIEGTVLLKLTVNQEGKVTQVDIVKSSGSELLDQAARSAVMKWHGKPATRWGQPIEVVEILPVRFQL